MIGLVVLIGSGILTFVSFILALTDNSVLMWVITYGITDIVAFIVVLYGWRLRLPPEIKLNKQDVAKITGIGEDGSIPEPPENLPPLQS